MQSVSVEFMPVAKSIYGVSHGTAFAAISSEMKQLGRFTHCKDYQHEVIRAAMNNAALNYSTEIYNVSRGKPPLDRALILFTNPRWNDLASACDHMKEFMNGVEELLHISPGEVYVCEDPPEDYSECGIYLWEGDDKWLISPTTYSLWLLLLRNAYYAKKGETAMQTLERIIASSSSSSRYDSPSYSYNSDVSYLKSAKSVIPFWSELGLEEVFGTDKEKNYPSAQKIGSTEFHAYVGVHSYAIGVTQKYLLEGDLNKRYEHYRTWKYLPEPLAPSW